MSARDVIADIVSDWSIRNGFEVDFGKCVNDYADEVIARLGAQGFAIVPKALLKPKVNAKAFARLDEMAEADIAMDGDHALSILLKHYRELTAAKEPTP